MTCDRVRRLWPAAFTLIELLVVVAIIGLLLSILLPALSGARRQAVAGKCLAQLRVFGHGFAIYTNDYRDVLPPGRLPKVNNCNAYADILGGRKFRPTFAAMMSQAVGLPPFSDPKPCKNQVDRFGENGDMQNFDCPLYVCPAVPTWTDERNGAYAYNYQFLGNSRLWDESDQTSYKNWPVVADSIRYPARTVVVADGMGTAASYPTVGRGDYLDDSRDANRFGNEGFNLDPPRVDPGSDGEMASAPEERTAVDPRHKGRGNVLWLDAHADAKSLRDLGYKVKSDGEVELATDGEGADNSQWSGNGKDVSWTRSFKP